MSVYTECSDAARRLAGLDEPFTDATVVTEAGREDWTDAEWQEANKHAQQILYTLYRNSRIVRFGPVQIGPSPDYLRKGDLRLVHAGRHVTEVQTPNGTFPQIMHAMDPIQAPRGGRRQIFHRDDFRPWAEQTGEPSRVLAETLDTEQLQARVRALEADFARAQEINEALTRDNARLRTLRSDPVSDGAPTLTSDLAEEVVRLLLPRLTEALRPSGRKRQPVSA